MRIESCDLGQSDECEFLESDKRWILSAQSGESRLNWFLEPGVFDISDEISSLGESWTFDQNAHQSNAISKSEKFIAEYIALSKEKFAEPSKLSYSKIVE